MMRLYIVRLGLPVWNAAYKRDAYARHWWLDLRWWRLILIQRLNES